MSTPGELRVMTYNVRSLRDDVGALADVVRSSAPDVLLVQEAPRFLRWRSKRAALAREAGLVVATTDRPGGLCIMTALRVDLLDCGFTLLPKTDRRHQRVVVTATVRSSGGARWRLANLHLSTDNAERAAHLPAIIAELSKPSDAPTVVGGDINEGPDGSVFSDLATRYQDCFAVAGRGTGLTSPALSPRRRIDSLFADPSLMVASCEAVGAPGVTTGSDHRPVLAVLRQ
jgi:endonuclease/exonuclease/phosphatase family metal-dependent hydrolase